MHVAAYGAQESFQLCNIYNMAHSLQCYIKRKNDYIISKKMITVSISNYLSIPRSANQYNIQD